MSAPERHPKAPKSRGHARTSTGPRNRPQGTLGPTRMHPAKGMRHQIPKQMPDIDKPVYHRPPYLLIDEIEPEVDELGLVCWPL